MKTTGWAAALAMVLVFSGCKKDKDPDTSVQVDETGVFVLNEGNFQWGNASLSFYNSRSGKVQDDLFKKANGRPLGDVLQSMSRIGNSYFLVVNNSRKIEVVDMNTLKTTAVVNGLLSPRYIVQTKSNEAYVSDLYANAVHVINTGSLQVTGSIPCPGWTEEMLVHQQQVFITNVRARYLYVADIAQQKITDSVNIGYGSSELVKDKNGKLWVACTGDTAKKIDPTLQVIDPVTLQIVHTFTLPNIPSRLCINPQQDRVYFLMKEDVYAVPIAHSGTIGAAERWLDAKEKNFYGLGIEPVTGDVYIADALDYTQQGNIYRYGANGEPKAQFKAGFIPNEFYFKN